MKLDDATLKILAQVKGGPLHASGLVVSAVGGPDANKRWHVEDIAHRRVLLGQSPACDVKLTDRSVSRRHASLELDGARLRLMDLGSRNGTYVGGFEIREVYLRAGAEIGLGQTMLRVELDGTSHEIPSSTEPRFHRVLGTSAAMRRLYPLLERLVGKATHVLLEGEPGTGKELVAEVLHEAGGNADAPFVVFEPASVGPEAVDGELLGAGDRPGLLEQANGGALFIDEVGDLPVTVQSKLLRAIQKKELRRADGRVVPLEVRVLASTRMDLDAEVQNRRFRDDLLLALSTPRVELPPLRRRSGDVPFLTQCFWVALGGSARGDHRGLRAPLRRARPRAARGTRRTRST